MKISLKWLNDLVDVQEYFEKPEALAAMLTAAGLEVEEIENKAKDFNHVVIGQILEKGQHPNADKLTLCQVTTGEGVVHQIVCGARNHNQGDKIVVALPGAVLPGNFVIKKSAIRNVESGGMLCSLKELGLAGESDGIVILPTDAPVGKNFAEYKGLDDVCFELKVTPNRADCLSHFGLAREVATITQKPLKAPSTQIKKETGSTKSVIQLNVQNTDLCPRYTGRVIQKVKVAPSPEWLQKRIESVGLKSINNIVDVTNYMMMELGQPMHAFDLKFLKGNVLNVKLAQAGEKFKTLDGTELTLKGHELMIQDAEKSVAMAGVIGGLNSGIQDSTQDVFLECAYFLPQAVRKASRSHGINTDSGYRFSRGVDPTQVKSAMDRAAQMIVDVAGGEILAEPHDVYPNPIQRSKIQIHHDFVTSCLGYPCDGAKLLDYLKRLGCEVTSTNGTLTVLPPTFRFDLETDMDLVEEYARLNGYEHIPESIPVNHLVPAMHDKNFIMHREMMNLMRGQGFSEARNYAFTSDKYQKELLGQIENLNLTGLFVSPNAVPIMNPLNEEINVMRTSLAPWLVKNLNTNYHSGNQTGRLFELGFTFAKNETGYQQFARLGGIAWGHKTHLWNQKAEAHPVVFEVKAAVESILKYFGITAFTWAMTKNKGEVPSFIHRGQFATLTVEGKKIGFIGSLHPVLLDDAKIRTTAAFFELDLDLLLKGHPRPYRTESLSKFPVVERDLALVMPQNLDIGSVQNVIRKAAGGILQAIEVFDVYQGDKLEKGQKSVALRLKLLDKTQTLAEAQITETMTKVLAELQKQLNIGIR